MGAPPVQTLWARRVGFGLGQGVVSDSTVNELVAVVAVAVKEVSKVPVSGVNETYALPASTTGNDLVGLPVTDSESTNAWNKYTGIRRRNG